MSKLREIKRRISSVNNISQVTHAMELVAASRMKRAQENAVKGKIYAEKIRELMVRLTFGHEVRATTPLVDPNYSSNNTVLILLFSPQRGLAGSLPGNLLRFTLQLVKKIKEQGKDVKLVTVGKKVRDQLSYRGVPILADFSDMPEQPTTADIRPILKLIEETYLAKEVGQVLLVFSDYVSALVQIPVVKVILPLDLSALKLFEEEFHQRFEETKAVDFLFEPSREKILAELVPAYLETQVYQACLEKVASEYSARMVAMKNATENAKEIKDTLTLEFNKSRQAQITRELTEITAGRMVS